MSAISAATTPWHVFEAIARAEYHDLCADREDDWGGFRRWFSAYEKTPRWASVRINHWAVLCDGKGPGAMDGVRLDHAAANLEAILRPFDFRMVLEFGPADEPVLSSPDGRNTHRRPHRGSFRFLSPSTPVSSFDEGLLQWLEERPQ